MIEKDQSEKSRVDFSHPANRAILAYLGDAARLQRSVSVMKVMPYISKTPKPPYYAVVFTSVNANVDPTEHVEMYARLIERASTYEGFIGSEPARNSDGTGLAAVYFKDLESMGAWAKDPEHQVAKRKGRELWYAHYMIRICRVEREYGRPDW